MNEFRDSTRFNYSFNDMTDHDLFNLDRQASEQIDYESDTIGMDQFIEDIGQIASSRNLADAFVSVGVGIIHSSSAAFELNTITGNMNGIRDEIAWAVGYRLNGAVPGVGNDEI